MTNPHDPVFESLTKARVNPSDPTGPCSWEAVGLSKREYFSAMALNHEVRYAIYVIDSDDAKETFQTIAVNCVRMADALIAELSKVNG